MGRAGRARALGARGLPGRAGPPDRRGAERPPRSAARGGQARSSDSPEHRAPWRPTPAQLDDARHRRLPDVIAPGLDVLFCGINPGLYSTAVGHHFARPGNRFWPALHLAGFTPRLLSPFEDDSLLGLGHGLTNICPRTTARADELTVEELRAGARTLCAKVARYRPRFLAVVGLSAYRAAFALPRAVGGQQPAPLGATTVWLLPSPSGLNAHHPIADLAALFAELRMAAAQSRAGRSRPRPLPFVP